MRSLQYFSRYLGKPISHLNDFLHSLIYSKNSYVHKRNWIFIRGLTNQLRYTLRTLFLNWLKWYDKGLIYITNFYKTVLFYFCIFMIHKHFILTIGIWKKNVTMRLAQLSPVPSTLKLFMLPQVRCGENVIFSMGKKGFKTKKSCI